MANPLSGGVRTENEKLSADFPVEFLERYGPSLFPVAEVLGTMASRGEVGNLLHAAKLFKLMFSAAAVVAGEMKKKKDADEFRPGWVM